MAVINPLTAHLLLKSVQALKEGDWIIQSAANSAVGEYLIQLAAQRGINTINVVRRESLVPQLKSLGATVVLVDGPDLAERAKAANQRRRHRLCGRCRWGRYFHPHGSKPRLWF